ncbi:MAG TPA: hypothetical protein VMV83_15005 [Rectinemataceae bacterium]|nr:hypothetical protein [Rectinemataceae bacterium]
MDKTLESVKTELGTKLFPDATWLAISDDIALAFRMSAAEKEALGRNKIARLVASLPYLAGCEDAGRTAVAHLGTYLLSTRETKHWFDATARDSVSVLERLWLGADFRGGDEKIIRRGLNLLALNMIADYKRDIDEDAASGKYNPLAAGDFDFKETVEDLEWSIISTPCPEMDEIVSLAEIPMSFWVAS